MQCISGISRAISRTVLIKYLPGAYWDFFDHYLPLTELVLTEVLKKCGFKIEFCQGRFLPYTMSDGKEHPIWGLRAYLSLPVAWRIFGRQFLVIASKPIESAGLHPDDQLATHS